MANMNYVDHLDLFGVPAKEIPCIKFEGPPTESTVGAVGLFGMDTLTGDVWKCTAVDGGKYVWELFGEGSPALADIVTPQMFGAIGDGVSDDTEAILAAISSGKSTVFIPDGTYRITTALSLDYTVRIRGSGKTILVFTNGDPIVVNADSCVLSSLFIRSDTTNKCIVEIYGKNCTINSCELDGLCEITDTAYTGQSGGKGVFIGLNADNTTIVNNYIHNTKCSLVDGWHAWGSTTLLDRKALSNIIIKNNIIRDSETGDAIDLIVKDSLISDNSIGGKWQDGVCIHAQTNSNVERVVFEHNTIDGYDGVNTFSNYALGLRQSDDGTAGCIDCRILNNSFVYPQHHIEVNSACCDTLISGNKCNGTKIVDKGLRTNVTDNYFTINYNTQAIEHSGDAGIISNNMIIITNNTDTAIYVYGEKTYGTTISNNILDVSADGITTDATGRTMIYNNIVKSMSIGITANNSTVDIIGNDVTSVTTGVQIGNSCANALIENNSIIVSNGKGVQCGGSYHSIRNNRISATSSGINCTSNTGVITVADNSIRNAHSFFTTAATYIITGNDFGGKRIYLSDVPMFAMCDNNINYSFYLYGPSTKYTENGVARQAASPTSSDAANVWGSQYDLVKKYDIEVEDTSVTPYQRYVLRSDNNWHALYT